MTDAKDLLSGELIEEIEACARAQNKKPAEVLEEAVRKYLDEQSWQAFVAKAEERNRGKGLTEDDVPRLVVEVRRENQERSR